METDEQGYQTNNSVLLSERQLRVLAGPDIDNKNDSTLKTLSNQQKFQFTFSMMIFTILKLYAISFLIVADVKSSQDM